MSIDHPVELAGLRAAGRVVAETLRELARRVRPGVTTRELDDVAGRVRGREQRLAAAAQSALRRGLAAAGAGSSAAASASAPSSPGTASGGASTRPPTCPTSPGTARR